MNEDKAETQITARKILVVRDCTTSDAVYEMLGLWGYHVKQAGTLIDAIQQAAIFQPDQVFVDMQANGIDGYEVALRMRHYRPTRKAVLVAVTNQIIHGSQSRLLTQAGFDYYLGKPLRAATVISVLEKVSRQPALR